MWLDGVMTFLRLCTLSGKGGEERGKEGKDIRPVADQGKLSLINKPEVGTDEF